MCQGDAASSKKGDPDAVMCALAHAPRVLPITSTTGSTGAAARSIVCCFLTTPEALCPSPLAARGREVVADTFFALCRPVRDRFSESTSKSDIFWRASKRASLGYRVVVCAAKRAREVAAAPVLGAGALSRCLQRGAYGTLCLARAGGVLR